LLVICAFMAIYYMLFGVFSAIALAVNLLLLVAVLSMLQATLTLPAWPPWRWLWHGHRRQRADQRAHPRGAARRRLAAGGHPRRLRPRVGDHPGLHVTSLIAGLALLAFGSGPVRGFAVVHCIAS
jgi:preprotein translocase subunit SecD